MEKLSPEAFAALCASHGGDESAALSAAAKAAQDLPHHVPISEFTVGAALLVGSAVYRGINLEADDVAFSVHAEQSAVHNALTEGEKPPFTMIAVTASPCGLCRQFMTETGSGAMSIVVEGLPASTTLATLLPHSFSPELVGKPLMGHCPGYEVEYAPSPAPSTLLAQKACAAALAVSQSSWLHAPAAVALLFEEAVITGVYLESVAHNPTLHAAPAALNKAMLCGHRLEDVRGAVLACAVGKPVDHGPTTRRVLSVLCPHLDLDDPGVFSVVKLVACQ